MITHPYVRALLPVLFHGLIDVMPTRPARGIKEPNISEIGSPETGP